MMTGMLRVCRVLLEPAAHLPAVELGHHDVQQDQVGPGLPGLAQGVGAVADQDDLVAFLDQVVADQLGHVALVLDHEDPPSRAGPAPPGSLPRRRPSPIGSTPPVVFIGVECGGAGLRGMTSRKVS